MQSLCSTVGHDHGTKELHTYPLIWYVWAATLCMLFHVILFKREGTNHARGTPNSCSCKSLSSLVIPLRNAKNAKNAKTCQGFPKNSREVSRYLIGYPAWAFFPPGPPTQLKVSSSILNHMQLSILDNTFLTLSNIPLYRPCLGRYFWGR